MLKAQGEKKKTKKTQKRQHSTFEFDFVCSISTTKIFADDVDAP